MAKTALVLAAAGRGTRMGTAESKQYLHIGDKPIIVHTLETFATIDAIDEIVIVVHVDDMAKCRQLVEQANFAKPIRFVEGLGERQDSVFAGLRALSSDIEWVLVHDAVRPFVQPKHILACLAEAQTSDAAILAVPAKDTIKVVDAAGHVVSTPDRQSLWLVQTPQAFRVSRLIQAHEQAEATGTRATDDAMVAELAGMTVSVVQGDYTNIKITTPEDLDWAALLLKRKESLS
ncbi:MAG: hypothetical protein RLZZ267_890 [Bacillota bacterium]|jgi:2-C-methyl-D-erythritol 4-phosphate cytidylyltransferase